LAPALLVVGSGHSAVNALLELAHSRKLIRTRHSCGRREASVARSGGDVDQLPARGELGADVRALVDSGRVKLLTGFAAVALSEKNGGVIVEGATADGVRRIGPVDRIVAATGQRPDLSLTRELRLDLDPWLESAKALGARKANRRTPKRRNTRRPTLVVLFGQHRLQRASARGAATLSGFSFA
jgi:thioredoxin reductase